MAIVDVDAAILSAPAERTHRNTVWTTTLIGYVFFIDSVSDLVYRKTTDGGATWGAAQNIVTGTVVALDVHFDKWTPGDTGTKIHYAYIEQDIADAVYGYLDTATDTLGGAVNIFAGASVVTAPTQITLTKARGGNLYCLFDLDGGTEVGFYRSTDSGASWGSRTFLTDHVNSDFWKLFPGANADAQDVTAIVWDVSRLTYEAHRHDDSANTWAVTDIATVTAGRSSNVGGRSMFDGAVRHSDNAIVMVGWNDVDTATADMGCWVIADASITAKTDVVANSDDCYFATIAINQNNDDLYVGYIGKSDGSETLATSTTVNYKISTDDGATWGSEQVFCSTAGNYQNIWTGMGGTNSRFNPVFLDVGNSDLSTDGANGVELFASIATAALVLPSLTTAGTAGVAPSATAALVFGSLVASGTAEQTQTATGAVTLPSLGASGVADMWPSATGAATLPNLTAAGAVIQSQIAESAATLPSLVASGTATQTFTATGEVFLPSLAAAGSSAQTYTSTAALILPSLVAAVSALQSQEATAALVLPSLATSGAVTQTITGTAALTLPSLATSGVGDFAQTAPYGLTEIRHTFARRSIRELRDTELKPTHPTSRGRLGL